MKVTRVAAIAFIWLMVLFGLSRCEAQEDNLEDSEGQDFDDYSSLTSSDSKTFDDYGDNLTRNRPYPIALRQLPAVTMGASALPGLLPSDLFHITVTIPPAGSELSNQFDFLNIDGLPLADGTPDLNLDGLTSFAQV